METKDPKQIEISSITLDPKLQLRGCTSEDIAAGYAELIENGVAFPPIVVFEDRETGRRWVGDGNHTLRAHQILKSETIWADIRIGTRRDALLYACGANKHGIPYSSADKRRITGLLLADSEWGRLTLRKLAVIAGVSHTYVAKMKQELASTPRATERGVNVYTRAELAPPSDPEVHDARRRPLPDDRAQDEQDFNTDEIAENRDTTGDPAVESGAQSAAPRASEENTKIGQNNRQGKQESSMPASVQPQQTPEQDLSAEELAVEAVLKAWLVLGEYDLNTELLDRTWLRLLQQARQDQELPDTAGATATLQVQMEAEALSRHKENAKYQVRLLAMARGDEELDIDFIYSVQEELREAS